MLPRKKPFHGLGVLIEGIIATVQAAALGTAAAIQHDKVRKAQSKTNSVLNLLHQQRMEEIQSEGQKMEEALRLKAEAALYEEQGIRTAAYMGVTTAIIVSLVLVYFLYRSKRGKKKE